MTATTGARAAYALLVAGVASTLVLVSLPVFVGAMATQFGLDARQVGWLASADMAGSAAASLCFVPFIGRVRWRPTAIAALVTMIAANLLCTIATSLPNLLLMRALAGVGGGIVLSIAFVGLCRSEHPDRYFGIYVFAQLALQTVALAGFPALLETSGLDAIFLVLGAVAAASLLLVPLLPATLPAGSGEVAASLGMSSQAAVSPNAAAALLAQGVYFLAPGAVWGYLERIGQGFGLSLTDVGFALGASTFAGMAGALLVVTVGSRAPRGMALAGGSLLSILAVVLLMDGSGLSRFLAAAALFNFAWNATFPYQMGLLASLDRTGAVAIFSLLVQVGGLALGPLIASMLHPERGFDTLLLACIGAYVASLGLFALSVRMHGQPGLRRV